MNPQILGTLAALAAVAFALYLLRRGVLPERFAALWILISGGLLVLAVLPSLLGWLARITGVQVPLNLLLFISAVVLLLVSVQLSFEVGKLEARTRRLAEEIALLTYRFDGRQDLQDTAEPPGGGQPQTRGNGDSGSPAPGPDPPTPPVGDTSLARQPGETAGPKDDSP